MMSPADEEYFTVNAEVHVSRKFFGWYDGRNGKDYWTGHSGKADAKGNYKVKGIV